MLFVGAFNHAEVVRVVVLSFALLSVFIPEHLVSQQHQVRPEKLVPDSGCASQQWVSHFMYTKLRHHHSNIVQ